MDIQHPAIFDLLKTTIEEIYSKPKDTILESELTSVHQKVLTFLRTCKTIEDVVIFYELSVNLILKYLKHQAAQFKLEFGVHPDTLKFLGTILEVWEKHETAMDCICFILEYFDKYNCSEELNCICIFEILPYADTLGKNIQFLVRKGREQKNSNEEHDVLRCINDLVLSLQSNDKRNIYGEIFEDRFLKTIEDIYKRKSFLILSCSITMHNYLRKVNSYMKKEKNLAYRNLCQHTWKRVEYTMREVLVYQQMNKITGNTQDGMEQLIDEENGTKLKSLYNALILVLGNSSEIVLLCEDIVIDCFQTVTKKNLLMLAQNAGIKMKSNRKLPDSDASTLNINFIRQRLLSKASGENVICYDRLNTDILTSAIFQSVRDSDKQISIDFVEGINLLRRRCISIDSILDLKMRWIFESIVTNEMQALFQQIPDEVGRLLALYADQAVQKKGNLHKIKKVTNITSIMSAKFQEVFGYHYHLLLARRYLRGETRSIVEERQALEKITELKRIDRSYFDFLFEVSIIIFRDLAISEQMNKKLNRYLCLNRRNDMYGVEFRISVLNSYIWPLETTNAVKLPKPVSHVWKEFENLCTLSCDRRVFSLVPKLGIVELRAYFYKSNVNRYPQVYSFVIDTYQMCVLMLFNENDFLTYEEIQMQTGIPAHHLQLVLQSLVQGIEGQALLIPNKSQENESCQLGPGYIFTLNQNFYSARTYRLKVESVQLTLKAKNPLSKNKQSTLDIERAVKQEMQKCQQINQNALLFRVTSELRSHSVVVHIWDVKSCVNSLVERGCIVRTPENPDILQYRESGHK